MNNSINRLSGIVCVALTFSIGTITLNAQAPMPAGEFAKATREDAEKANNDPLSGRKTGAAK